MGVVAKIWDTLKCRRRAPIKVDAKAPPVFTDPDAKASAKAPPPPPEAQSAEVAKAKAQAAAKVLKEKGDSAGWDIHLYLHLYLLVRLIFRPLVCLFPTRVICTF